MKYEKPEIVVAVDSVHAIQSSMNKGLFTPIDGSNEHATSAAYEADE